ncbi:hypothetical protein D3C85_1710210 [compost metagenome]
MEVEGELVREHPRQTARSVLGLSGLLRETRQGRRLEARFAALRGRGVEVVKHARLLLDGHGFPLP